MDTLGRFDGKYLLQVGEVTCEAEQRWSEAGLVKPSPGDGGQVAREVVVNLVKLSQMKLSEEKVDISTTHVNQYDNTSKASCRDSRGYFMFGLLLQCSMCEYCAKRTSRMINHVRTHTKEKPYKCSVCNYESATKSGLARHMLIHGGEKQHQCDICKSLYLQRRLQQIKRALS